MREPLLLLVFFCFSESRACPAAAGKTESATWPMSNTLCIMRLMDDARAQLGVTYDSVRRSLRPLPARANRPPAFGLSAAQLLWCACARAGRGVYNRGPGGENVSGGALVPAGMLICFGHTVSRAVARASVSHKPSSPIPPPIDSKCIDHKCSC